MTSRRFSRRPSGQPPKRKRPRSRLRRFRAPASWPKDSQPRKTPPPSYRWNNPNQIGRPTSPRRHRTQRLSNIKNKVSKKTLIRSNCPATPTCSSRPSARPRPSRPGTSRSLVTPPRRRGRSSTRRRRARSESPRPLVTRWPPPPQKLLRKIRRRRQNRRTANERVRDHPVKRRRCCLGGWCKPPASLYELKIAIRLTQSII